MFDTNPAACDLRIAFCHASPAILGGPASDPDAFGADAAGTITLGKLPDWKSPAAIKSWGCDLWRILALRAGVWSAADGEAIRAAARLSGLAVPPDSQSMIAALIAAGPVPTIKGASEYYAALRAAGAFALGATGKPPAKAIPGAMALITARAVAAKAAGLVDSAKAANAPPGVVATIVQGAVSAHKHYVDTAAKVVGDVVNLPAKVVGIVNDTERHVVEQAHDLADHAVDEWGRTVRDVSGKIADAAPDVVSASAMAGAGAITGTMAAIGLTALAGLAWLTGGPGTFAGKRRR